jgi:LuxR family transcriptional regulator, maltose regulon positive regulatory protein
LPKSERARAAFEESLPDGETPEALEGMGWVGHMLNEDRLTFDARERAYRLYLERRDKGSAARIAGWLAADCLPFRGEAAIANGWLQRAHSLIDGLEPGVDHGWLAIHEGYIAVALDEDTVKARRLAARAVELGRVFGALELEMLGLGLEGRALVSEGELEEGMRRLDEATTVALGGEARLVYCVAWACCFLISACERVRDYERAAQWCARVGEFCGQHDIFLLNTCRAHYASVLSWQGRWDEAESHLCTAVEGLQASRPPMVGDALARLGELAPIRADALHRSTNYARNDPVFAAGVDAVPAFKHRRGETYSLATACRTIHR